MPPGELVTGSFSVQWTGTLNPPQTGNYTFSISPINVNSPDNELPLQLTESVSIGGQVVITANASNWTSQSNAIGLTANQPVAVQMTLSANVARAIPAGTLHAMLVWQGPGINQSIIPAANLTDANTGNPGLSATYSWTDSTGQAQTLTRTDPGGRFRLDDGQSDPVAGHNGCHASVAADVAIPVCGQLHHLALGLDPVQLHPFLKNPNDSSSGLTSAQRSAFFDILLANPSLMDTMPARSMWSISIAPSATAIPTRRSTCLRPGPPGRPIFNTAWHAYLVHRLQRQRRFSSDGHLHHAGVARSCDPLAKRSAAIVGWPLFSSRGQYLGLQLPGTGKAGRLDGLFRCQAGRSDGDG